MKNLTQLSLLFFVLFLFSCKPETNELVKGEWTFKNIEIQNYDELIEKQLELGKKQLNKKIKEVEAQIEEAEDETTKEVLQASIQEFKKTIEDLPERAKETKEETLKGLKEIAGKATMTFSEDGKFERDLTNNDVAKGSWKLSEDSKSILVTEERNEQKKEVEYKIQEITKEKLVILYVEEEGEMVMKMKMELKK